jgi:cellulose synthase/poly-beta-1,6-N-acetylglucosamine synthase-like glycosyltransferase
MIVVEVILFVLGCYLSLYVGYSLFLCLANWIVKEELKEEKAPSTRFAVLIPAHNEELLIGRLLESLNEQDYPKELFEIVVVADNCDDRTKDIAIEHSALVLERQSAEERGKGYAISFALSKIDLEEYHALLIVDADSIADLNALRELDREVQRGKKVIQCLNGVENTMASWFTVLMNVSRTLSNEVLEPATNKIGFSSHLVGNGMCFTKEILSKYGWNAFSVGEDWEHHAKLIEMGEKVWFAKKVGFYHQESESLKQATPQRLRWSGGRLAIAWRYGLRLLCSGFVNRDVLKISGSLPLVLPNPSMGVNLTVLGLMGSFLVGWIEGSAAFLPWYGLLLVGQGVLFVVGIAHTKRKLAGLGSAILAPVFLMWKMIIDIVSLLGFGRRRWVRTKRGTFGSKEDE